ncbi:hypothetical protein BC830DRAFT_1175436 [Chytriomyces sp. MP71]|nr:hypothetical protein BC830DRAFT_1175436 [Chytriomyces sp. MP71]
MSLTATVSVIPIVEGASVAAALALVKQALATQSHVSFAMHARTLTLVGEWDALFETIKAVRDALHSHGVLRMQISVAIV